MVVIYLFWLPARISNHATAHGRIHSAACHVPQFDEYNFSSFAVNPAAYVVNNTIGRLHRVAVVLTLAATPGDLQEMILALAGNATQLLAMSNASSNYYGPISTIMHSGGFVKANSLAVCGGLVQKLRSSGDCTSFFSCPQGR